MQRYGARDHAFGTRLLAWRERAGLSQQEVATLLGVSARAVGAWEGSASYPDPTHLKGLLAAYLRRCWRWAPETAASERHMPPANTPPAFD